MLLFHVRRVVTLFLKSRKKANKLNIYINLFFCIGITLDGNKLSVKARSVTLGELYFVTTEWKAISTAVLLWILYRKQNV
jgi:hypothetical protein